MLKRIRCPRCRAETFGRRVAKLTRDFRMVAGPLVCQACGHQIGGSDGVRRKPKGPSPRRTPEPVDDESGELVAVTWADDLR